MKGELILESLSMRDKEWPICCHVNNQEERQICPSTWQDGPSAPQFTWNIASEATTSLLNSWLTDRLLDTKADDNGRVTLTDQLTSTTLSKGEWGKGFHCVKDEEFSEAWRCIRSWGEGLTLGCFPVVEWVQCCLGCCWISSLYFILVNFNWSLRFGPP